MEIKYRILYIDEVVKKHIPKLSSDIKLLIRKTIEQRLMIDPVSFGKPLRYSLKGHRRLRIGDYRVVYRIEQETCTVIIIAIKHRKDVYEDA